MFKKLICVFLAIFAIVGVISINRKNAEAQSKHCSEIAMELTTGRVLHESNADIKMPMASTTKILTAIIIIEDCNLDEVIKVPQAAVGVEGSSIYLTENEEIDIRDLLYGLMLRSGNDSATTLAIHHSGSVELFAKIMNERAKKIGAENSNFTNPSGLPDENHYTTARDLCKLAKYARQNEIFSKIVSTVNYTGKYKSFSNKNKMLHMYNGANGIKTGYTVKAGRCLVSSAKRNNMDIICVVLNCPDMYKVSSNIFDKCFNNFKLIAISSNKIFMCGIVQCKLQNNVNLVVSNSGEIKYTITPLENKNQKEFAELKIYDKNCLIFCEKLCTINI